MSAAAGRRREEGGDGVEEDDEEADFEGEPVPAVVALPAAGVEEGEVGAPQHERQQRRDDASYRHGG